MEYNAIEYSITIIMTNYWHMSCNISYLMLQFHVLYFMLDKSRMIDPYGISNNLWNIDID